MGEILFRHRLARVLALSLGLALSAHQEAQACLDKATAVAAEDLLRLPPIEQFYATYFWLGDVALKDRPRFILTLSGHFNALSRRPSLYFPQVVSNDLSLVRVNYDAYRWPLKVVKQLQVAHPYTTTKLTIQGIPWHGGVWPEDGKEYGAASFTYHRDIPVVSARWFIWQTMAQRKRTPGYYDFLELKSRDDFDKLVGFDRKLADASHRKDMLDAIVYSGVSSQPRNIVIRSSLDGKSYGTEDSEFALAKKNPLRIVDREFFEHEAEEWIGFLANGFLAFLLSTADGKLQEVAPPFLSDSSSPTNDKQIHPGLGCLRCHYRQQFHGSGGLIDPVPHFRDLLSRMRLATPDYKRFKEFEELYLRPFHNRVVIDRLVHNEAVINATGMPADIWALQLTTLFEQYDAGATLDEAAVYLGCDVPTAATVVQKVLQKYAAETGLLDPVLAIFADGKMIPRVQYHEVYPLLYTTWMGMKAYENNNRVLHLLQPGNAADGSLLKPAAVQPRVLPNVLPANPGLQQHDRGAAALRDSALHNRLPTAQRGNLGERGVPAVDNDNGHGWWSDGNPVNRTGDARSRGSVPASTGAGIQVRPPAVALGENSGRTGTSSASTRTAARSRLQDQLHGLPQGSVSQGRLPVVRPAGQLLGKAGGRWQDNLPPDGSGQIIANAAQWQPRPGLQGQDDSRSDCVEERGRVLSNTLGYASAMLTFACLAIIWWRRT